MTQSLDEFKKSLLELGFWEYSNYYENNKTHTFFILHGTVYTIEVISINETITSIIPF